MIRIQGTNLEVRVPALIPKVSTRLLLQYHVLIITQACHNNVDKLKDDTSPIVIIISGSILGTLCIVIVLITTAFVITLVVVIRSNRTLRKQLNVLKGKSNQQPAIYEEIPQRRESVKSSTPSIETGENTAYATVFLSSVTCNKVCK